MIDTILFDMDGTLLDSLDDLECAVNHALHEFGLAAVDKDEVRIAAGYGCTVLMDELSGHAFDLESQRFAELRDSFSSFYSKNGSRFTHPYPGIDELLIALKERGIATAVVSNKRHPETEALRKHFFSDTISLALGASPDRPAKPAPDMVLAALDALGSSPGRALYVGDSEPDVQVARASGCIGVAVLWGFRDKSVLEPYAPDHFIDRPAQLLDILGQYND